MELWNALAGIGAILAFGVAVWAVIVAHRANGRAEDSNRIAEDSLNVAKESHSLNERLAPPAWSQAIDLGDSSAKFTNQSGRHIVVTSLTTYPDEAASDMSAGERPLRVEHGDAFAIGFDFTLASVPAQRLIIEWHYEDEPGEMERTERNL